MDVLREREVKDSLERQLQDEQKVRGEYKQGLLRASYDLRLSSFDRDARRAGAESKPFFGFSASRGLQVITLVRPRYSRFEKIDFRRPTEACATSRECHESEISVRE